jgi:hypothetical protein
MNWQDFKAKLEQYPGLHLQFVYATNQQVAASYHITEIKQAPIVSVDCGGVRNAWTEIIIQLWEPPQQEPGRAMQVHKALKIVDIVAEKLPLNPEAIVKIEFGNSRFDTRQMYPGNFEITEDNLTIYLEPYFTQCKAINRGDQCNIIPGASGGNAATFIQTEMNTDSKASACGTPDSGCCQ